MKDRRYGQWNGNPNGEQERKGFCIKELFDNYIGRQCRNRRGYGKNGEYCKKHAGKD